MSLSFARSRMLQLLTALLALALFATACGGGDSADDTTATDDTVSTETGTEQSDEAEPTAVPDEAMEDGDSDDGQDQDGAASSEALVTEAEDDSALTPVKGGVLRYGLEAEVDGLNPVTSSLSAPGMTMASSVFDNLATYDATGNWTPYLAESFTPNEDASSWTMKLREGVLFHDGTPLNSEAVRVNFETAYADGLVGLAVRPFYPPLEEAFTVVDDLTVQFNLLDSDLYFPASLAGQLGMVASPTWLAAALEDPTLNQAPVGTGPFQFDSRSEDSVTRLVRNENWWNGEAYLDAIEFVPVTDSDIRTQLLLEDNLQGLHTTNVASMETMAAEPTIQNLLDDTTEESFIMLNSTKAPFDDIRARQALTHATPQDNYNALIGLGVNRPANQMFTPDSPFYNPDIVQLTDMPELAGPLVESYCGDFPDNCTDGRINMELQWSGPSVVQTRIADLLTEAWADFFNVDPDEKAQDSHILEAATGGYDAITWRQFGAVEPTRDSVWILCRTIGGISLNWPRFCDEERDELFLSAQQTTDEAERAAALQEVSAMINEAYTYVFFNHTIWDTAISDQVRNLCARTSPEGVELRCANNGRTWFDTAFLAE